MVLPKSTVHVSRLAGAALKSFTHGYAQTVVAASQSSYASQNTPVAPLASNFLSRFKEKPGRTVGQHAHFSTAANSQQAGEHHAKHDVATESALAHFHELWQKHHRVENKDVRSIQFAKRIGWKPSISNEEHQASDPLQTEELKPSAETSTGTRLRRSYSTSAVNDFAKAIEGEEAEAVAFEKVHESISSEAVISKLKEDEVRNLGETVIENDNGEYLQEVSGYTSAETELYRCQELHQYDRIPAAFETLLRSGCERPSQRAYQALLASALNLANQRQLIVPRVLDIYADMMRRSVIPDANTSAAIIGALAEHAVAVASVERSLSVKSARFGGTDIFALDNVELRVAREDQTLDIALGLAASAPTGLDLSASANAALITACASRGKIAEMIDLYNGMTAAQSADTNIYPVLIAAFGKTGDLANALSVFDHYRELAILDNSATSQLRRVDMEVHTALVAAYCAAGKPEKAKKFLARIDENESTSHAALKTREHIVVNALLPQELSSQNYEAVYSIINSLSPAFYAQGLERAVVDLADANDLQESTKAFSALTETGHNLEASAAAIYAAHLRARKAQLGEKYFAVLQNAEVSLESVQLATLRAVALIQLGECLNALKPLGPLLVRLRAQSSAKHLDRQASLERIEESLHIVAVAILAQAPGSVPIEAAAELLRIMNDSGVVLAQSVEQLLLSLSENTISALVSSDLETFISYQARMILDEAYHDAAAIARFSCMLETLANRSILPNVQTEDLIEKALVNIGSQDLNHLWNSYRYPLANSQVVTGNEVSPTYIGQSPLSTATPSSLYDESFDPYVMTTDHRGSIAITDLLEKSSARPEGAFREAMTKLRNIRRAGRHPRFYAYGKLVQAAAKVNQLRTAEEILAMARQDVPYLSAYRLVRHGWVNLLDSMVAAAVTAGRRDVAARYHQQLSDMGAAPSANTFGLYITSLKDTTKTFDEASEAVKIFMRSKAEGVEPTSFLYNALIGKLGKARRIDDCLFYFAEMRKAGIRPTSVTYGTIVNALCRVSDEKFAEEIFEEMESSINYKPRPAPYHSLMQFFLTTKRDRSKVLAYYERMRDQGIRPTMHTYKLLIDAHATLEPVNMDAAEAVIQDMRDAGLQPEAVHYASLIHAKGCVAHDLEGAAALFDRVRAGPRSQIEPCVYQAMIESLVANKAVSEIEGLLSDMRHRRVDLTPYIVNATIHGWTQEKNLAKAVEAFALIQRHRREPSTYEAMVRAHLACGDRDGAGYVVDEAISRGYPSAVAGKIAELVGGGRY